MIADELDANELFAPAYHAVANVDPIDDETTELHLNSSQNATNVGGWMDLFLTVSGGRGLLSAHTQYWQNSSAAYLVQ